MAIGKLVEELVMLVQPDNEDRRNVYKQIRELGPLEVDDYFAAVDALDSRDLVLEEALGHARHGREEEANELLSEIGWTVADLKLEAGNGLNEGEIGRWETPE